MNINLNNYEQWLLLYVDNELSAADRNAVKEFLGQYPYLQQELEALQQATLPLENFSFEAKDSLLKPLVSEEDLEKLLLQLDNELPATEKTQLQKSIANNNMLKAEWVSLQKAQLDSAEIIPFLNKQLLYKKGKGRVIAIGMVRWMAAAVLLGFGFYIATYFSNRNNYVQPGDIVNNSKDSNNQSIKAATDNIATVDPSVIISNQSEEKNNAVKDINNIPTKNKDLSVTNSHTNRTNNKQQNLNNTKIFQQLPKENSVDMAALNDHNKKSHQQQLQPLPNNNEPLPALNDVAIQLNKTNKQDIEHGNSINPVNKEIIDVNIRANRNEYAQTAAYTFDENNNSVLMMEEEDITRTKAGIFFKKLKRNIERRANVKPGKSLKIAGFELAVK